MSELNAWIVATLTAALDADTVQVNDDGRHFEIVVVSRQFEGQRMVKQQQLVYAALNARIADGTIHAVMMKTLTPDEWRAQQ